MAAKDDLEAARQRVSGRYLGVAGIHAVGASRKRAVVKLYVERRQPALDDVLPAIQAEAAPFGVSVVTGDRASVRPE